MALDRKGARIAGWHRRTGWLIAGWLCLQAATANCSPRLEVDERLHTYAVRASDAQALRAELDRPRPEHPEAGRSHALTEVVASSRLEVEADADGCRWTGPVLQLQMRTWLPDWVDRADAPAALQQQWIGVQRGLEVHEAGHRALARETAQEFVDAVQALDEDRYRMQPCSVLQRRVSALHQRMLLRLQIRQQRYDERTAFGAQQGASLVLQQAVVCPRRRTAISRACPAEAWPTCECPPAARSLRLDP